MTQEVGKISGQNLPFGNLAYIIQLATQNQDRKVRILIRRFLQYCVRLTVLFGINLI
jgi:hypothetical protein